MDWNQFGDFFGLDPDWIYIHKFFWIRIWMQSIRIHSIIYHLEYWVSHKSLTQSVKTSSDSQIEKSFKCVCIKYQYYKTGQDFLDIVYPCKFVCRKRRLEQEREHLTWPKARWKPIPCSSFDCCSIFLVIYLIDWK